MCRRSSLFLSCLSDSLSRSLLPADGQSAFVPHSERAISTYGNYPEPQDDSAKPYAVQSSTSPTDHTAYALSPTLESPHSFRPRT